MQHNNGNLALLILILVFAMIVTLSIHELGHFVFAKMAKVHVKEFSIGIGPTLFSFYSHKKNMIFSFRIILAGAFVMLESDKLRQAYLDDPNSKNYNFYIMPKPKGTYSLEKVAYWKQMLIMFGGILFNFLGFLVFLGIYSWIFKDSNSTLDLGNFFKNIFINIGDAFVVHELWRPVSPGGGSGGGHVAPFASREANWQYLLLSITSVNAATGVFNLLPIAPLDGSKIFQYTYERIAKKPVNEKIWTITTIIGVLIVLWISIGSIINQIKIG
ncbi:site-2 protease family protein [Mycoplasma sp. E35C]|uniref:site-2 protease family protein n=1 Tax=Mycoplasma sp. E35C TaxID=2801918 RepID=UPI001CA40EA5|nr:site-2 protease family protein [Mycoplasma sp. E35C]QZX49226.1 site-2 protease family protein [Mycoplasma sp. E35C]